MSPIRQKVKIIILILSLYPFTFLHAAKRRSFAAIQLFYKAVDFYDHKDYGGAKLALESVLQREPNFAEAFLLKGLLEYQDGKWEAAQASWEHALKLDPKLPDQIRERLEQQAHAIETSLTAQEFSHFRLQFHGAEQRDKAWQSVKYLNEVYNELGSSFGIFAPQQIPVIIFTSEEFWEAWNAPFWLGGFFDKRDGKIRVRIDEPPGGEEELRRRLRHEFTHAFIHQLYPKDLPVWFQEGIAQFYAYASPTNSFWKENRLEELRKATKAAPWMDMPQIEPVILKKNVPAEYLYLAYLESEALVIYVAKERGESWISAVVERLRRKQSFQAAFQDVVSLSPAEMLDHLKHTLQ